MLDFGEKSSSSAKYRDGPLPRLPEGCSGIHVGVGKSSDVSVQLIAKKSLVSRHKNYAVISFKSIKYATSKLLLGLPGCGRFWCSSKITLNFSVLLYL